MTPIDTLSCNPACEFLIQRETAVRRRLSERTLERYGIAGTGPAFVKLGRRVVYRLLDLHAWAQAQTRHSASDNGR